MNGSAALARLPAFFGLGLSLDSALFRAVRLLRGLTRPRADAPRLVAPEPARPWGIGLLVTLRRLPRAG
ncbi:MAG: hypothetical protein ACLGSA_08550 [Acidobacteriota bacterium]